MRSHYTATSLYLIGNHSIHSIPFGLDPQGSRQARRIGWKEALPRSRGSANTQAHKGLWGCALTALQGSSYDLPAGAGEGEITQPLPRSVPQLFTQLGFHGSLRHT